jgi:hypothetical protein
MSSDYTQAPETLDKTELIDQHDRLLRLQKSALNAGYDHVAMDVAQRRSDLWEEVKERGIKAKIL